MKIVRSLAVLLTIIVIISPTSGQSPADALPKKSGCAALDPLPPPQMKMASPVVWGNSYTIPPLNLRIISKATGAPLVQKEIVLVYGWEWFRFPRTEKLLGGWNYNWDELWCMTDMSGTVFVPEVVFKPRGWYKGKLLLGRKPRFKVLSIKIPLELNHRSKLFPRYATFSYTRAEIDKLKGEGSLDITLQVEQSVPGG